MNVIIKNILNNLDIKSKIVLENFKNAINKLNLGRASPLIIEQINIKYNKTYLPLKNIALITVINNNTIKLTVFYKEILNNIIKAILKSNLSITPIIKGKNIIFLNFPNLTVESKKLLKNFINQKYELFKINIRNLRREYNEQFKKMFINKEITKDELFIAKNTIEKNIKNFLLINEIYYKKKIFLLN